jgi:hypothetical protein
MITTHDADEARFSSIGPGLTTWRTAALNLGTLYVFINYGLKVGGEWIYQTSIFWDSRDVLDFVRNIEKNNSTQIVDISLLEPSRKQREHTWRWVKVMRILLYEYHQVEHPVYATEAGEMVGLTPDEAKRATQVLYSAKNV